MVLREGLQILDEAPEVYAAADRLLEAADWIVWQLTGVETRNACTAGYKAMWSKRDGFPDAAYFGALDPAFADVVDDEDAPGPAPGSASGPAGSPPRRRRWTGLLPGTAVAVANVDAHVAVPAATVTEPGTMVDDHGHLHVPHGPRARTSGRCPGCAAASRTGSCPG